MISQQEADDLLNVIKHVTKNDMFYWRNGERYDEIVIADEDESMVFVLSLKKNEFEIRLNFRSKNKAVVLARIDNAYQHFNPDGTRIVGPHLHLYKEGGSDKWAEAIDWYNVNSPIETLSKFLEIIHTRFLMGYSEVLL